MLDTEKNTEQIDVITSWVREHSDKLYARAMFQTNNVEVSEDLVQETFLAATKSFETFDRRSKPSTWLFAILNNKIADYHRRNVRDNKHRKSFTGVDKNATSLHFNAGGEWLQESKPKDWQMDDFNPLDDLDFLQTLEKCLSKLPPHWHEAVKYKYLEDKETETICQDLEITVSNYWQIIHRAKLQLRICIESNWLKA